MTDRLWRTVVSILVLSAALVGCGGAPQEIPPVPTIGDARDASTADPCALLTPPELAAVGLGGGVGATVPAEEGPSCRWHSGNGDLDVTLYTGGGGLATLAANSEPTTTRVRLVGYPALETFTGKGEFCQYDVGVAEHQVVSAALAAPAPDSCEVLQKVMPDLLGNLPTAAPTPAPPR